MKAQYPRALWVPHNNYWQGRGKRQLRYVIVHAFAWPGASPTAQQVAELYVKLHEKRGPHYLVGRAGDVVQCVQEQDAAWSNGAYTPGADAWWGTRGNPNLETVSVEVIKAHGDHSDAVSPAQREAVFALIAYLCRKWKIPARWADAGGGITGHFSIDPINYRYCPGPFPWEELFWKLRAPADAPPGPQLYVRRPDVAPVASQPALDAPAGGASPHGTGDPAGDSVGARAHAVLQDAPGFAGIVKAMDTGEQLNGVAVKSVTDIPTWLSNNALAILLRLSAVVLGLLIVGALVWSLVRRNSWMGEARADLIPLALADMSATGRAQPERGAA